MLISHHYQVIFVHVQKTGGTSIHHLFQELDNDIVQELPIDTGKKRSKHCFISDIHTATDPDIFASYTKFAVVRNPFDRLFSWYCMFKNNTFENSKVIVGVESISTLGNAVEAAVAPYLNSFDSFLSMPNEDLFARFYYNQLDYLTINHKIAVDYVLRFENLNQDFETLVQKLNLPNGLPTINKSIRPNDYRAAYNQTTQRLVAERFARDLDYFSYSF